MEQYLNLVWKNYTASLSPNSDGSFIDDQNDESDIFANNDLLNKVPFWIGAVVISLLFFITIIATIRYCFLNLCSSHDETEKLALMPPKSPCLSSNTANTIQRQKCDPISHHSSDDNETLSSSPEQIRNHHSNISIIRQHSRSHFRPTRYQHSEIDSNHYFSPTQIPSSRIPVNYQKKIQDIYVLPVSPALSSTSSTINTDETVKTNSNTMPVRARRHLSPEANIQQHSTYRGIRNKSFTNSPQPKDRTLTYTQPPSQPPPLPPTVSEIHVNHKDKSPIEHLDPSSIPLRFKTVEKNQIKKAQSQPPPVPSRSQKPSLLPIGFEELTEQSDQINYRLNIKPSPQDDCSEHSWPKPPESMTTSQISRPSSIPYDHLIPTVIMRENSTTNFFHQYRHDENSMLTESET